MATYANMGRADARAELSRRGLKVKAPLSDLVARLQKDDTRGEFTDDLVARLQKDDTRGEFTDDLEAASIHYLRDGCSILSINSVGSRESGFTTR